MSDRTHKRPRNGSNGARTAEIERGLMNRYVGHLSRVVQVRLFQLYYERLAHLGVSPAAFAVLGTIRENPGIQHGALAHVLAVRGPNLTKLVDQLVRAGYMERRSADGDKRVTGHFLTTSGRKKADAALEAGLTHDEYATSPLTAAERKKLLELLAKLEQGLSANFR